MKNDVLLVICTFPDADIAAKISRVLVEQKLAACANILPGMRSIYRWKDALEESAEVMVFFKTSITTWPEFRNKLADLHPYEVPELLAFPARDGLDEYLDWVMKNSAG